MRSPKSHVLVIQCSGFGDRVSDCCGSWTRNVLAKLPAPCREVRETRSNNRRHAAGHVSRMLTSRDMSSGQPTSTITIATTATLSPGTATTTGGLLLNYTAASPTSVSTVSLDCPGQDQKTYTTGHNQTFVLSCYRGLQGADFATMVAYSYADCIEACSSYNAWTANKTGCSGIQFTNTMGATYLNDQGNC